MFEKSSKTEGYVETKQVFTMELFCEYSHRITIFAIKAPS